MRSPASSRFPSVSQVLLDFLPGPSLARGQPAAVRGRLAVGRAAALASGRAPAAALRLLPARLLAWTRGLPADVSRHQRAVHALSGDPRGSGRAMADG